MDRLAVVVVRPHRSRPSVRHADAMFPLLVVVVVVVAVSSRPVSAVVCPSCTAADRRECPSVMDCPGGTVPDACECCLECARVEGEPCGGGRYRSEGRCDEGLVCIIAPLPGAVITGEEIGTCRTIPIVTSPPGPTTASLQLKTTPLSPPGDVTASVAGDVEDCSDVECTDDNEEQQQLVCPSDSSLVAVPASTTETSRCCPGRQQKRSRLTCRCLPCPGPGSGSGDVITSGSVGSGELDDGGGPATTRRDSCPAGQVRLLKSEGSPDTPGQCCDVFECIDQAKLCDDVECDFDPYRDDSSACPDDSFRLPTLETQDGCCLVEQGCQCKSLDSCPEVSCPDGLQKRLRQLATGLPGYCCDVFDCVNGTNAVCLYNGTTRTDGDQWMADQCTSCRCRDGLSFCEPVQCPRLGRCGWIGTPDDACCPVCKGCVSQHGDLQPSGSTWLLDSCVTCRCDEGQIYCQAQMCSVSCASPRMVPDECCPVCDDDAILVPSIGTPCPSLSNCTLMCPLGYERTSSTGCYKCECVELKDDPCDLECPNGYRVDLMGLEVCDCAEVAAVDQYDVSYDVNQTDYANRTDGTRNSSTSSSDSTPTSQDYLPLPINNSFSEPLAADTEVQTTCPPLPIGCDKQCLYGYRVDRFGCSRCRCNRCPPFDCTKRCREGFAYSSNGCRLCRCLDANFIDAPPSQLASAASSARLPPTVSSVEASGRQCVSAANGRSRPVEEGQSWWDGCRRCFCREGHEMCALTTCPALRCINPVFRPNSCCPTCPGETALLPFGSTTFCHLDNGRYYGDGDTWQLDDCTLCICHQGTPLCVVDSCPPTLCRHPVLVPKMCCPVCPDEDGYLPPSALVPSRETHRPCHTASSNRRYASGDTWRVDACQSCTCRSGQIVCFSQTCPITACRRPVLKKGQCCPVCSTMPPVELCTYSGNVYQVGESWLVDQCTQCTCISSIVHSGGRSTDGSAAHGGGTRGTGSTTVSVGQVLCTMAVCDASPTCGTDSPVLLPGLCCPVCPDQLNGTRFRSNNITVAGVTTGQRNNDGTLSASVIVALIVLVILILLIVTVVSSTLCFLRYRRRRRQLDLIGVDRSARCPLTSCCAAAAGCGKSDIDHNELYHRSSLAKSSPPSSPRSAPPRYVDAPEPNASGISGSAGAGSSCSGSGGSSNCEDDSSGSGPWKPSPAMPPGRKCSIPPTCSPTESRRFRPAPDLVGLGSRAASEFPNADIWNLNVKVKVVNSEKDSAVVDEMIDNDDDADDDVDSLHKPESLVRLNGCCDLNDDGDDDESNESVDHRSGTDVHFDEQSLMSSTRGSMIGISVQRLSTADCDTIDDDEDDDKTAGTVGSPPSHPVRSTLIVADSPDVIDSTRNRLLTPLLSPTPSESAETATTAPSTPNRRLNVVVPVELQNRRSW